ncbi:ABC transporter substrate-binding protein [Micromonospora sp. NPDC005220]|uniref:ABC transporter substrate-binding protein n=1 Tax=Micromonospora sp. NPDC005220 TaxID=3155589 RepID=UPI0033BDE1AE
MIDRANLAVPTSTVVIDVFDDVPTLDPHRGAESASRHPILNVYESLLGLDTTGHPFPRLAAALPRTERRGSEWEVFVPLRDDVRFHDGAAMTIDDVVYSLRRSMITSDMAASLWADPLLGAPVSRVDEESAIEMARRVTAASGGVLLRMPAPFSPLNALIVQWALVVRQSWCRDRGEWDGDLSSIARFLRPSSTALDSECNGTGAYRLEFWNRASRELSFRRSEYGSDTDAPERIVLRSVDDRTAREGDLLDGTCDFSVCQPESRERLGDLNGVVLEKLPEEWGVNPIAFINQRLDPGCEAVGSGRWGPDGLPPDAFSDVHLRRMLTLCFDHERYVAEALDGEYLNHRPPFPAPALPPVTTPPAKLDIEAARAEFEQAWDGQAARKGCRIVIYTHTANISRQIAAELLAEGLRAVSRRIVVEIISLEIGPLMDVLYAGAAPVLWMGWAGDFLHPYAFASALVDARAPLPAALGINDPVVAQLVRSARVAKPEDETAIYERLAERVADEALFLVPPGKVSYMTYSDRWEGVRLKNHVPNVLDFTSFRPRATTR